MYSLKFSFVTFVDKAIAIQLQGAESFNGTGRVEVFYKGQWGTICRSGWDIEDTNVICRELGYEYSIKTLERDHVPKGTGPIWLNDVSCTGKESYLSSCFHSGWGKHSCLHNEDVGVECSSTGNVTLFQFGLRANEIESRSSWAACIDILHNVPYQD